MRVKMMKRHYFRRLLYYPVNKIHCMHEIIFGLKSGFSPHSRLFRILAKKCLIHVHSHLLKVNNNINKDFSHTNHDFAQFCASHCMAQKYEYHP